MDDILNLLETFKPINVAEQVYVKLKKMLFEYEIVPGQKLQYQDLAEKFKVSRTPVKDALNKLEKEGYVELKHNRGYFVAEIRLKEAEELFDVRESLETLAIQKAIGKLNHKSLGLLKQSMQAYSTDVNKEIPSRRRLLLDANFHLTIAEISGNKTLVEILRMIFSKIYLKQKIDSRGREPDNEHKEIYKALSSKDVSIALSRMKKHIALNRRHILGISR